MVPVPWEGTYLDDIMGAGADVSEGWANTLACIWQIALSGLPINLCKFKLLQYAMPLLGVVLCNSCFQLGKKALGWLIAADLPRMLRELQGLVGKL